VDAVAARHAGLTPPAPPARSGRVRSRALTASVVAVVLLLCAAVTGILPVQVMRIGSGSMAPTLPTGGLVVVSTFSDVARRDVVVVHPPGSAELLVKRAVAVGGDEVAIEDGVLVVNGDPVCEPGIDPDRIDGVWFAPVAVPEGELFLLGDDRRDAVDSRDFGTVRESDVAGVVGGRVWPRPGSLDAGTC
jgi:signal peptidase I